MAQPFTFKISCKNEGNRRGHVFIRDSLIDLNVSLGNRDSSRATLSLKNKEDQDPVFAAIDLYNLDLVALDLSNESEEKTGTSNPLS